MNNQVSNAKDVYTLLGVTLDKQNPYLPYKLAPVTCDNDGLLQVGSTQQLDAAILTQSNGLFVCYPNFVASSVIEIMNTQVTAAKLLPLRFLPNSIGKYDVIKNFQRSCKVSNVGESLEERLHFSVDPIQLKRQLLGNQVIIAHSSLKQDLPKTATEAIFRNIEEKQRAAAQILAQKENASYLFGDPDQATYGLLNAPNLDEPLAPQPVPNDSLKLSWPDKLKDKHLAAEHIFNDVNTLWEDLRSKNNDSVTKNNRMALALSPERAKVLSTVKAADTGLTVEQRLKETWPNLDIVAIQELSLGDGKPQRLYLIVNDGDDQLQAGFNAFYQRLAVTPIGYPNATPDFGLVQYFNSSTFGCVITQPSLISYMTGI